MTFFDPDSLTAEISELTSALVQANSPSGGEKQTADLLAAKLRSLDFDEVHFDRLGSITAVRRGSQQGKMVLWDAHLDVVDVSNPEDWTVRPFSGEVRDGKLWGRGATDIKGGLAAMAVVAGRFPRAKLAGTLILNGSIGEEKIEGCGLTEVIEAYTPDVVVIAEPTGCQLAFGHKGRAGIWIEAAGRPAHSSSPHLGENAIYKAVDIIQRIQGTPPERDPLLGDGVMELVEISSRPFPGESTVPYGCRLRYDRRLVRRETRESVLKSIEAAILGIPGVRLGYQPVDLDLYSGLSLHVDDFHAAWCLAPEDDLVSRALAALSASGLAGTGIVAPYCTNGSFTAGEKGIPTIIFGPSHIHLAHIVDEYVEIEQLTLAARGYAALAETLGSA